MYNAGLIPATAYIGYDDSNSLNPQWPSRHQRIWNWLAAIEMPPNDEHDAGLSPDAHFPSAGGEASVQLQPDGLCASLQPGVGHSASPQQNSHGPSAGDQALVRLQRGGGHGASLQPGGGQASVQLHPGGHRPSVGGQAPVQTQPGGGGHGASQPPDNHCRSAGGWNLFGQPQASGGLCRDIGGASRQVERRVHGRNQQGARDDRRSSRPGEPYPRQHTRPRQHKNVVKDVAAVARRVTEGERRQEAARQHKEAARRLEEAARRQGEEARREAEVAQLEEEYDDEAHRVVEDEHRRPQQRQRTQSGCHCRHGRDYPTEFTGCHCQSYSYHRCDIVFSAWGIHVTERR